MCVQVVVCMEFSFWLVKELFYLGCVFVLNSIVELDKYVQLKWKRLCCIPFPSFVSAEMCTVFCRWRIHDRCAAHTLEFDLENLKLDELYL